MSYKIRLDNFVNFYKAGDCIRGRVICTFDNPTRLTQINMLYQIEEDTNLDSEESLSTNTILWKEWPIINNPYAPSPGTFACKFEFVLGERVPPSFEREYGKIVHKLSTIVDGDCKDSRIIQVKSLKYCNRPSEEQTSRTFKDITTLCNWSCTVDKISMVVEMPYSILGRRSHYLLCGESDAFMSCRIRLENYDRFYTPGTEIIGRVQCNFAHPVVLKNIKIELERIEVNRWYQFSYRTRGSMYIGCHDVIIIDTIIYGSEDRNYNFSTGTHNFPFVLNLPKNLPSSYKGPYSVIAYHLKTTVGTLTSTDFHGRRSIKILAPLFCHSFPPEDLTERIFENDKTIGNWCLNSGEISMAVTMPRMVFAPGETIDVRIQLTNLSNKNVRQLKVSFEKVITLKARAPSYREKLLKDELFRIKEHGVGAHGDYTYNISIPISTNTEIPNFTDCKLMKVHYLLLIKASIEGCISNFKIKICPNLANVGLAEVSEDAPESAPQTPDLVAIEPFLETDLPSYQSLVIQPPPFETPPPTYNNI